MIEIVSRRLKCRKRKRRNSNGDELSDPHIKPFENSTPEKYVNGI